MILRKTTFSGAPVDPGFPGDPRDAGAPGSPGAPEASGPLSLLPPEAPGSRGAPLSPGLESGALRYPGFPEGGALELLESFGLGPSRVSGSPGALRTPRSHGHLGAPWFPKAPGAPGARGDKDFRGSRSSSCEGANS